MAVPAVPMATTLALDGTVAQMDQVLLPPTEQHAVQIACTTPFQMNIVARKGVPVKMEGLALVALRLEVLQETEGQLLQSALPQQQ